MLDDDEVGVADAPEGGATREPPRPPLSEPIADRWRGWAAALASAVHVSPVRAVALALLLAGGLVAGWALLRPAQGVTAPELTIPTVAADSRPGGELAAGPTPTELVVHVAGAVQMPGVYRLPAGSRVDDALGAAGGPAGDADIDRVNLASPLRDGDQVRVPRVGEPAATAAGGGSDDGASTGAPIDLNRASVAELDELPGIGPATAEAIVADREQHGPFRSVDDLLRVRGIGPARLEQLRPLVTV